METKDTGFKKKAQKELENSKSIKVIRCAREYTIHLQIIPYIQIFSVNTA